jgi:hypothetical protein
MIDWLSLDDIEAQLLNYAPSRLALCSSFHARSDEHPGTRIPRASEEMVVDGIGTFRAWAGFVDEIPFSISTGQRLDGHAIEVRLPVFVDGDAPMFGVLAKLPLPPLLVEGFWIESPRAGSFGVARKTGDGPLYTSTARSDALAATQLLDRWHPGEFVVTEVDHHSTSWLVVGPTSGRFVTHVAHAVDEESARRRAAEYSSKRNAVFTAQPRL